MRHSKYDQTLALAGIYQVASLVKQIANKGTANSAHIASSLETLFRFDAASVEQVYGGLAGVMHGIRILCQDLGDNKYDRDLDITRYVVSLVMLERKLSRNRAMLNTIRERLDSIESQLEFFALEHDNTLAKLGQLYRDTISTLGPKIMVSGEQPYLSNQRNADRVRALLLAGIRSAVLWNQCGGSRLQLLFGRKAYRSECRHIIDQF